MWKSFTCQSLNDHMMHTLLNYQKSIKNLTSSRHVHKFIRNWQFQSAIKLSKTNVTVDVSASSQLSFRVFLKTSHRTLNHGLQTKLMFFKQNILLPSPKTTSQTFQKHISTFFFPSQPPLSLKETCKLLLKPACSPRNALNSSRTDVKLKLS